MSSLASKNRQTPHNRPASQRAGFFSPVLAQPVRLVLFAIVLLSTGCASLDTTIPPDLSDQKELTQVPFHAQMEYHCGPAALATMLEHSQLQTTYAEIVERVYIPGLQGSLQAEMMAATRHYQRIPFRVPNTLAGVLSEVAAGNPVLILQNQLLRTVPAWHYAVVIGYDRASARVLMRSGNEERKWSSAGRWMRRWDRAGRWGIVVLKPGQLPQNQNPTIVLRALSDFDDVGTAENRLMAWSAAAQRWPDNALVHLGMGNAAYAVGDHDAAARHFRRSLAVAGTAYWPARLNLSNLLLEQAAACEALEVLSSHAMPLEHPLQSNYESLRADASGACSRQLN